LWLLLAALLYAARPGVAAAVPGDANCNGVVDDGDMEALIVAIMQHPLCAGADANGDGRVSAPDLSAELLLLAPPPTRTATPVGGAATATATSSGTLVATPTGGAVTVPPGSPPPSPTRTMTGSAGTTTPPRTGTQPPSPTSSPTNAGMATATVGTIPSRTFTATLGGTAGTSTPTRTPTASVPSGPTPTLGPPGPSVVFLGTANANGCPCDVVGPCLCYGTPSPTPAYDAQGRRIFRRLPQTTYLLVVEVRPGPNNAVIGTRLLPSSPADRPDLQIEVSNNLGLGGAVVDCRSGLPRAQWDGVPGFPSPDFGPSQVVTDALTDLACRFQVSVPGQPCTLNGFGEESLLNPNPSDSSVRQFCYLVENGAAFKNGDTIVTAQVRDVAGQIGPGAQIVVRVAP